MTSKPRYWRLCLPLIFLELGLMPSLASTSSPPAGAAVNSSAGAWTALLDGARDLGPSDASSADVLVNLRSDQYPTIFLRWATQHGVRASWLPGQMTALVSARPSVLARALGTVIDDYRLPGFPRFYAAVGTVTVPESLRSEVSAFGRISSLADLHAEGTRVDGIPVVGLGPGGFLDAYNARPLRNQDDAGQSETIVFFEVDGYSARDLATYASHFRLPPFADPLPHVGALDLKAGGESTMDLETAHAIAPGAKLVYVNLSAFGGRNSSPATQFAQAFSTVAKRYPGAIWSISLGQCEDLFSSTDLHAVNRVVASAESKGTTVFVASGDSGGLECLGAHQDIPSIPAEGVSFPGDLPNVTSVGGTTLHVSRTGGYVGETSWSEPLLSQGSTEGQSMLFAKPSWQRGPGVISSYSDGATCAATSGTYCREVPDVAADAAPTTGAAVRYHSKWLTSGGTSLATPEWAAFTTLIDEYLHSIGIRSVGNSNPLLYKLASGTPSFAPLHEVTFGSNDFYPVTRGYNMVTGLGTPDVWNLARDLVPLLKRVAS